MNEDKHEEIEEVSFDDKPNDIEVVDLDESKHSKVKNTLEIRKENRLLFIIIGALILFALALPTVTKIFRKTSIFSYTSEVEDITSKGTTEEGLLEIGTDTEGSITVKNIQFYSFTKKTNNTITFVYLPGNSINKVSEENIYIELYNSKKNVIYRTKFEVASKLERKVRGTYSLTLNENIYGESTYAKVVILNDKDFAIESSKMVCTIEENNDNYDITTTVTYNFSTNGLINYNIEKEVNEQLTSTNNVNQEETEESLGFFEEEINEVKEYVDNLDYTETTIKYKVDLVKGTYTNNIYELGNTPRQIKLDSEDSNWSCE